MSRAAYDSMKSELNDQFGISEHWHDDEMSYVSCSMSTLSELPDSVLSSMKNLELSCDDYDSRQQPYFDIVSDGIGAEEQWH